MSRFPYLCFEGYTTFINGLECLAHLRLLTYVLFAIPLRLGSTLR